MQQCFESTIPASQLENSRCTISFNKLLLDDEWMEERNKRLECYQCELNKIHMHLHMDLLELQIKKRSKEVVNQWVLQCNYKTYSVTISTSSTPSQLIRSFTCQSFPITFGHFNWWSSALGQFKAKALLFNLQDYFCNLKLDRLKLKVIINDVYLSLLVLTKVNRLSCCFL